MRLYTTGQLSNAEKNNILDQHRSLYDGYRKVYENISNEQPLYVQDYANDKEGITVNNRGEVKKYTNVGINEQQDMMAHFESELDEIGVKDLEKGKKYKFKSPSFEDDIEFEDEIDYPHGGSKHYSFKGNKAGHLLGDKSVEDFVSHMKDTDEGIYDIKDLDKGDEFDYVGGDANLEEDHMDLYEPMESAFADEMNEQGIAGLYSDIDFPAYDFQSKGPMQARGPYGTSEQVSMEEDDDDFGFESPWCPECKGSGCEECDGSGMKRNSIGDEDERETAINKMRRGKADIEDIDWEDIHTDDLEDTGEFETASNKMRRGKADIEDIDWEDIDEDLRESFISKKNKINEMMNRMSKF
jgi:hypothetical protein